MRVRGCLAILLLTIGVSGCVDDGTTPMPPAPAAEPDPAITQETTPARVIGEAPRAPRGYDVPVNWTGTLGTGILVCETDVTAACHEPMVAPRDNDVLVPVVTDTILRGVTLTLEWHATTPANELLTFDVMTMAGTCATCGSKMLATAEGPSPLVVELDALDQPLATGQAVHAYAYNGALFHHAPPLVAGLSLDDEITIAGHVAFQAPARAAS